MEREKEEEIVKRKEEVKEECTKTNDILNGKIQEQMRKEFEEETKRTVETEVGSVLIWQWRYI